ncbi:TPA: hypothetical protein ACGTP8_000246 [Yersinia enterocolitica]
MAVINISRIGSETQRIEVELKFGVGKTITASMTLEDFALAITGRSEIPVDIKTRRVTIGGVDE